MRLRTPKRAYRVNATGKWHLENPRAEASTGSRLTVCRFVLSDETPSRAVARLNVDEICLRCIGPCEAVGKPEVLEVMP